MANSIFSIIILLISALYLLENVNGGLLPQEEYIEDLPINGLTVSQILQILQNQGPTKLNGYSPAYGDEVPRDHWSSVNSIEKRVSQLPRHEQLCGVCRASHATARDVFNGHVVINITKCESRIENIACVPNGHPIRINQAELEHALANNGLVLESRIDPNGLESCHATFTNAPFRIRESCGQI